MAVTMHRLRSEKNYLSLVTKVRNQVVHKNWVLTWYFWVRHYSREKGYYYEIVMEYRNDVDIEHREKTTIKDKYELLCVGLLPNKWEED